MCMHWSANDESYIHFVADFASTTAYFHSRFQETVIFFYGCPVMKYVVLIIFQLAGFLLFLTHTESYILDSFVLAFDIAHVFNFMCTP